MHNASDVGQDVAGEFNQDQIGKGCSSILEFILTGGSITGFLVTGTVWRRRNVPGAHCNGDKRLLK